MYSLQAHQIKIAEQLFLLSRESKSRQLFFSDGSLVLNEVLQRCESPDEELAFLSCRTLQNLSDHSSNKLELSKFEDLQTVLMQVRSHSPSVRVTVAATKTLENIGVWINESDSSFQNAASSSYVDMDDENCMLNGRSSYRQLTLQVPGMNDEETSKTIQRILVKVPGVISLTVDREQGTLSIGNREGNDVEFCSRVCAALEKAGIISQVLGKNSLSCNSSAVLDENQLDESGYLDEADFEEIGDNAVTKWGTSSLEARLEAERLEEEWRNENNYRLFSRVSSAISNASSWLVSW